MLGFFPDLRDLFPTQKRGLARLWWWLLGALQLLVASSLILTVFHPDWIDRHDVPFVEKALSTIFLAFLAALPVFSLVCYTCGAPKPAVAAIRFFAAIALLIVILMPMDL